MILVQPLVDSIFVANTSDVSTSSTVDKIRDKIILGKVIAITID